MTGVTVSIWHNVARDQAGPAHRRWTGSPPATRWCRFHLPGHAARALPGGDRRGRVRAGQRPPPRRRDRALARLYYQRRLRSMSVGDIVCVGEVALAVGRPAGWEPASGPLAEVRTREHGTSPLPLPGRSPGSGPAPDPRRRTTVNEKKTVTAPGEAAGQ